MKRLVVLAVTAIAALAGPAAAAHADEYGNSLCQERPYMCVDPSTSIGKNGTYTGHDEPSVIFTSKKPGTGGKDLTYFVTLPKDPPKKPNQAGTGGTWNFQLRATYWLGLTMCDSQSSPNYTHTCKPNSDGNAKFRSLNPNSKHYIGKSPGSAYMELQFYAPGWVPQFAGFGCTATKWCANMTIDSFSASANTNAQQNADCLNNHFLVGPEPINWAYLTRSGKPQAPANSLALSDDPNLTGLNPDPSKDLLMNGGDRLRVHMHDTRAGYRVDITDLTTHQHGSMTASKANGFGQILFQPNATTCHERPYAFHPMYNSAVKRGPTWTAHTYNVAASDEIGHFEYCNAIDPTTGGCTQAGSGDPVIDADDEACLDGAQFDALIPIIGCVLDDGDFDGPTYQHDWPGSFVNAKADAKVHTTPFRFTVPTSHGRPLANVSFETDLARIERGEPGNPPTQCDALTGANCTNPPIGAKFYPIYTLANSGGKCWFQQGDVHIPGTFDWFGGSSATEYGHLLFVNYPEPGFTIGRFAEDFHRDLHGNPCNA